MVQNLITLKEIVVLRMNGYNDVCQTELATEETNDSNHN